MCSNSFSHLSSKPVNNNLNQGCYRARFFELKNYNLSKIELCNYLYKEEDIDKILLLENYSFAYLREDKLRTITAYNSGSQKINFRDFLDYFNLKINSNNIFKSGKYLSRVFRPVKYGSFYNGLKVHINKNESTLRKNTDGISLISLDLAKSLGWKDAQVNNSAQFTLLFRKGLVKGNCVVSDKIKHDVVIYGMDNIKTDISLTNDTCYVSLEPLKLSDNLRIDIQSLLNLWPLFGGEQYLRWAYTGMQQFKTDLMSGNLNKWLNDAEDLNSDSWTLQKAICSNIDYRRFPGLLRQAWGMFRRSLIRYAHEKDNELNLRIPVPGGLRGYIRIDLRNHDIDGNFMPTTERNIVTLDILGNLWIHEDDVNEFMLVKGGADMDDSVCIIPIEGEKAVIYRNPNQYGEYGVHQIKYEGIEISKVNKLTGKIPYRKRVDTENKISENSTGNKLLDSLLSSLPIAETAPVNYDITALLRSYNHIKDSNSSIGLAANAEMILSAVRISNPVLADELNNMFNWNLESIIDSQVKDGISADKDMEAVQNLLGYIYYNHIPIPENLFARFPEKMRKDLQVEKAHPFDELIQAVKYLINKTDVEILGRGSVRKCNRIPGLIDKLDIPVREIGLHNLDNRMNNIAGKLLKEHNRAIAIMLERTKQLPEVEKEVVRSKELEKIQIEFLSSLKDFVPEERQLLVKGWAYKVYSTDRSPHDSVLWIKDNNGLKGTAVDTINILNEVLNNPILEKDNLRVIKPRTQSQNANLTIRLWSKLEININTFKATKEIQVIERVAIIGNEKLHIGDECKIQNGIYKVFSTAPICSRKNKGTYLKNNIKMTIMV